MTSILKVEDVRKAYPTGFEALKGVSLEIEQGEIIALLGPNGAGKTTLISTICGIASITSGSISIGGFDISTDYRKARDLVGLVPQEITLEPFETVMNTVRFSRGLFGRKRDDAYLEKILKKLSLWDKKDNRTMELSGGMRRRVLIAKALSHEPRLLFLDEPTAGVDVELRKDMWGVVAELKKDGVTIILTTHYIEEAEEIADRVAVISKGEILLVEEKSALMARMGQKRLKVELQSAIEAIPDSLSDYVLELEKGGTQLVYTYDTKSDRTGITKLLADIAAAGLTLKDLQTVESSLEDIFVGLVHEDAA